jgi:hypothetical protein
MRAGAVGCPNVEVSTGKIRGDGRMRDLLFAYIVTGKRGRPGEGRVTRDDGHLR